MKTSENNIASVQYLYKWKDGGMSCRFICSKTGTDMIRHFKTERAAKTQATIFLNRCARLFNK